MHGFGGGLNAGAQVMGAMVGAALVVLAAVVFAFSLPRAGKTAKLVGTQWEPYVVVGILCAFAVGLMLLVSGAIQLL